MLSVTKLDKWRISILVVILQSLYPEFSKVIVSSDGMITFRNQWWKFWKYRKIHLSNILLKEIPLRLSSYITGDYRNVHLYTTEIEAVLHTRPNNLVDLLYREWLKKLQVADSSPNPVSKEDSIKNVIYEIKIKQRVNSFNKIKESINLINLANKSKQECTEDRSLLYFKCPLYSQLLLRLMGVNS